MRPMTIPLVSIRLPRRPTYGAVSLALGAALVAAVIAPGGGGWQLLAFAVAPDLAGLLSIDPSLERGRMHPRAVPLYNLLHNLALPLALGVVSLLWLGVPWLVGALTWALHITLDRAIGYGPRTPEGFQRD